MIFSFGLKLTNNLDSLLFFFGDCKTGFVWAKQVFSLLFFKIIVSQSLNFPIFFISWAEIFELNNIKTMKRGSRIMITGYNQKGSQTIDHYSLLGFTKSYGAAKKSCS